MGLWASAFLKNLSYVIVSDVFIQVSFGEIFSLVDFSVIYSQQRNSKPELSVLVMFCCFVCSSLLLQGLLPFFLPVQYWWGKMGKHHLGPHRLQRSHSLALLGLGYYW